MTVTARELAIVRLIAAGYVNNEIAAALGLQPAAIASRSRWLYEKAGVNRREALVMVFRTCSRLMTAARSARNRSPPAANEDPA